MDDPTLNNFHAVERTSSEEKRESIPVQKTYTALELMSMNRHDRRAMGKINGVKIPGITKPALSNKHRGK